jgi:hypothetical protein
VDTEPDKMPIEVANPDRSEDKQRLDALAERYEAASQREQPLERARKKAPKVKKARLPITDREYYEYFGPEDANKPCRTEGCTRGAVHLSVFCRTHHFESVMRKPCPWTD